MVGKSQENDRPRESEEDLGDSRSSPPDASWMPLTEFIFGDIRRLDSLRRFTLHNLSQRLRREVDPDEILIEVCITGHEDFAMLPEDARRVPWIKKGILNRIRNLARTLGRRKRAPPDGKEVFSFDLDLDEEDGSTPHQVPSPRSSPEEIVMIEEDLEQVWEMLDILPPEQAALIRLVHFKETPLEQAATLLGMTEAKASHHLREGLVALRDLFEADDPGCCVARGSSWMGESRNRRLSPNGAKGGGW